MDLPHIQVKTKIGFILIILGVLPTYIPLVYVNLIMGFTIILVYRIPFSFLWKKIKPLLLILAFSFIFFPIYEGWDGFLKALLFNGRLFFVAQILTFILYRSTMIQFLQVLHQMRIPSIFIELMMFTLRFMEVFISEIRSMMLSLKSKGFYLGKWFNPKKYLILSKLLGSLLVRSMKRSEKIFLGMLSRGYSQSIFISKREEISRRDWLKGIVWVAMMGVTYSIYLVVIKWNYLDLKM